MRKDGMATKQRILTVCVRLFLEQGYKETTITQITEEAKVTRGSFQNLFPTKDAVLMELVETMFSGQFGAARTITGGGLPADSHGAEREPAGDLPRGLHPAGHGGVHPPAHHRGAEGDLRGQLPRIQRQRFL